MAAAEPERSTLTIEDATRSTRRVPTDWLREFGGTAAAQVVDALDERLRCMRDRRSREPAPDLLPPRWRCTRYPGPAPAVIDGRSADAALAVADASVSIPARELAQLRFSSTRPDQDPVLSLWGRGAFSRFANPGDALAPDGDVASATFGADVLADRLLGGIAVSHSRGEGTVSLNGAATQAESSLTSLHPYLRLAVNESVSLWGTAGLGSGTLSLTPEDAAALETPITLRMVAAGAQAELISPAAANDLSVALKADALLLRIDAHESASLDAAFAAATRLRLVLEGAYEIVIEDGQWLAPFLEVAARFDGSDVAAGLGAEIGGGIRYADRAHHLTAELEARVLLVHAVDASERWSMSGSLRYDPSPDSELGPYFTLSSSRAAPSGLAALADPAAADAAPTGASIGAELGYGVPLRDDSATGTPWVGVALAQGRPQYRLGYRLAVGSALHLGLEGTLRHGTTDEPPDYALVLLLSLR